MAVGFAQWGNDLYTGRKSYDIVGRRKIWYGIAIAFVLISAALLIRPGLNPGIEFRGGSEFVVSGVADRNQQLAIDTVQAIEPAELPRVTTIGKDSIRVQTAELTNVQVEDVRGALATAFGVPTTQVTSTFIGPTWGADVSRKAVTGLIVFLVLVSVVMTAYFRNWRMAVAALAALFHDIMFTAGVYAADPGAWRHQPRPGGASCLSKGRCEPRAELFPTRCWLPSFCRQD